MADYIHPQTCELQESASALPSPWTPVPRPVLVAAKAIPPRYRKWDAAAGEVIAMTPEEQAAADAAEAAAAAERRYAADLATHGPAIRTVFKIINRDRVSRGLPAFTEAEVLAEFRSVLGLPPLPESP